jgi:hypothetical protein
MEIRAWILLKRTWASFATTCENLVSLGTLQSIGINPCLLPQRLQGRENRSHRKRIRHS